MTVRVPRPRRPRTRDSSVKRQRRSRRSSRPALARGPAPRSRSSTLRRFRSLRVGTSEISPREDLVVENPNRRKLEACLVTTIMVVVVCIMGLLLFVVIELQPAGE
ncbi:hypothetical protein HPB49_012623 [Dermacentor silvarum]|uniref:Uncharacterized protein n=1 Tax=Dermacentor silvarum TaxID=543639 RepID=A0ACB8D5I5_DERSI|nr:hypothetical protein HPB49_012623 [Dermacentor silvarum]